MSSSSQEEGYSPQCSNDYEEGERGRDFQKKVAVEPSGSVEGKWTEQENIRYALFMDFHSTIFESKERRKSTRIFKSLSVFLGSRTPRQCRSHFQKIMLKFKKLNKVKQHYQKLLGCGHYASRLEQLTQRLRETPLHEGSQSKKAQVATSCQTDALQLRLQDLSRIDVLRLMNLLNDYYRAQSTPVYSAYKVEDNPPFLSHRNFWP